MKKTILTIAAVVLGFTMNAQTYFDENGIETFHIDSLFEDASTNLLTSKVTDVPDADKAEIKRRILNYAGVIFRDISKVLVSESDDQLVFNYIDKATYKSMGMSQQLDEYIRLVIQIKDGRFRISAYDDGNAFIPGTYSKSYSSPAVAAHTYYFTKRFTKEGTVKNKGMFKPTFQMIQSLDINVTSMINDFSDAGLKPSSNESAVGGNDNW